jgi:hypothetical protein
MELEKSLTVGYSFDSSSTPPFYAFVKPADKRFRKEVEEAFYEHGSLIDGDRLWLMKKLAYVGCVRGPAMELEKKNGYQFSEDLHNTLIGILCHWTGKLRCLNQIVEEYPATLLLQPHHGLLEKVRSCEDWRVSVCSSKNHPFPPKTHLFRQLTPQFTWTAEHRLDIQIPGLPQNWPFKRYGDTRIRQKVRELILAHVNDSPNLLHEDG